MMVQQKKYIRLRNLSVLCVCGFLCYSIFPFPPVIWRLAFLATAIYTILPNVNEFTRLEKWVLGFWGVNMIYFLASFLWLSNPSITLIGNISVSLFAIPFFMTLGRKGVMTDKFFNITIFILLFSSYVFYLAGKQIAVADLIRGEDATINAGVVFVLILPFILLIRNRYFAYIVTIACVYFLMESAKRGNIFCALPVIFLFIINTFRSKDVKLYEKIIFIVFFIFAISLGVKSFLQNDYLQARIEQTLEGNSSARDIIYADCWNTYISSDNVINIIFGYGYQGTVCHPRIGLYAHNDWLEILVDYGVFGIFFYLSIFSLLLKYIRKEKNLSQRHVLIAIVSIWFLKTAFSMGFTEETLFVLFIPLGYVFRRENQLSK